MTTKGDGFVILSELPIVSPPRSEGIVLQVPEIDRDCGVYAQFWYGVEDDVRELERLLR